MSDAPLTQSRWSDVYIDSAARLLAGTGMFGAMTALMLLMQGSGAGGAAAAALVIATMLPMVLLAPLTGRLIDRIDSRLLIIVAGVIRGAASLGLAYTDNLIVVLALVVVLSCGTAILQPTLGALIPAMVTRDDLAKASAIGQTASTLGMVAGPALAGLLVGQYGVSTALLVNAGCAIATVAAGFALRTRRGGRSTVSRTTAAVTSPTSTWRLSDDGLIKFMVVGLSLIIGVVGAVNVVEVFFVRETLQASETLYGIVTGSWAAGMAVGAWLLAAPIRKAAHDGVLLNWMFLAMGVTCAAITLMGTVGSVWPLVPMFIFGGALNGAENTLMGVLLGRRVPPEFRGKANATLHGWVNGFSLAGFAFGGLALEWLSPREMIYACGLAGLLVVVLLFPGVRRAVRAEQSAPRQTHAPEGAEPVSAHP